MTDAHSFWSPLLLSLKVATTATAAASILGTALAYGLSRSRSAAAELGDAVASLPLVLPPTVLGYYLLVVFGRRGWVGRWLDETFGVSLVFTWQGAALACVVAAVPLVVRSARAAFEEVDPRLEVLARVLGMRPWKVFFCVSLPLAWRGILAGTILGFARCLGEFGATLMVAGNLPGKTQTLALAVYDAVQAGDDALAASLVATVSAVCLTVLVASRFLLRPRAGRAGAP